MPLIYIHTKAKPRAKTSDINYKNNKNISNYKKMINNLLHLKAL
ncbi:hypothetical protein [Helicobacter trogontum]|uniref:Uncharacterized protein n=1 Tax=Helicobacter trogontum TaxID=50960 RepID=A0ABQ0D3X3_9HELI|nr:hypothetical protein [Helicobacter trogontum]